MNLKKFLISLIIAGLVFTASNSFAEEDYDPQNTMLALDMAIVSIHKIATTQDRIILEQEYQNIINNLSLGNIESDYELTALYQEMMTYITGKRLRNEDAKIFQSRYDRRKKNLLMDALGSVRAYGGNIYSWLGSWRCRACRHIFNTRIQRPNFLRVLMMIYGGLERKKYMI